MLLEDIYLLTLFQEKHIYHYNNIWKGMKIICYLLQGMLAVFYTLDCLKLVIKRKCFPKCRSRNPELHKDDQQLIQSFNFWLTGQELNHKPSISPPSCTAWLLHWQVLGVLLGNVARCKDPQLGPRYDSAVWR